MALIKKALTTVPVRQPQPTFAQPTVSSSLFTVPKYNAAKLAAPIITIWGGGTTGKTTLASTLAALGKVAYLGIDYRHPQTDLNAFAKKGLNIVTATFEVVELAKGQEVDPKNWQPEWNRFWEATMEALTSPQFVGAIIDKWVVADRLCRLALWGRWEKVPEMGYEHRNARLKEILTTAIRNNKILVLVTNEKEKREDVINENTGKKNSVSTGEVQPAGWKNTGEATTLELWCTRSRKDGFDVECTQSVVNWDLVGTKVTGQTLPQILKEAFPGVVIKTGWGK